MKIDKVKLIAFIFGVIIVFLLVTRPKSYQFDTNTAVNVSDPHISRISKKLDNTVVDVQFNDEVKDILVGKMKPEPTQIVSPREHLERESRRSLERFETVSRLSVDFDDGRFFFTDLDLEEDRMIGTYGFNGHGGESLAMLATDMKVTESLFNQYIRDYADEFPSLRKKAVRWDKAPVVFGSMKDSGLADAKVWRGASPDGLAHVAVWIPRADDKGHYGFIYSTPNPQDLENDGFFDNLYSKLKALPEK